MGKAMAMVDPKRLLRHLATTRGAVNRHFPAPAMVAIEAAIHASEADHTGEIRFAVEAALDGAPLWGGQTPRARAIDVFSSLRVWDTAHNNGVLIYLLLADHAVEIVADRGIHVAAGSEPWTTVCEELRAAVQRGDPAGGVIRAIDALSRTLVHHFPTHGVDNPNELPDRPVVL